MITFFPRLKLELMLQPRFERDISKYMPEASVKNTASLQQHELMIVQLQNLKTPQPLGPVLSHLPPFYVKGRQNHKHLYSVLWQGTVMSPPYLNPERPGSSKMIQVDGRCEQST
jgi:hypothetical protein